MSQQKELEIQMQFLEEATGYLNVLETVFLGINNTSTLDLHQINAALRAAHSIKGNADIIGFWEIGDLAHRLEESLKVVKSCYSYLELHTDLENLQGLLLSSVDCLRQGLELIAEGKIIDSQWLERVCHPIFRKLQRCLRESEGQDSIVSPDKEREVIRLLFETEIEACLQELELQIAQGGNLILREKLVTMAEEFGGLAEMLQLSALRSLCSSIGCHVERAGDSVAEVAQLALKAWRHCQDLVSKNQLNKLPKELNISAMAIYPATGANNTGGSTVEFFPTRLSSQPVNGSTDNKYHENTVRVSNKQLHQINDLCADLIIQRYRLSSQLDKLRKLVNELYQRLDYRPIENHQFTTAYQRITEVLPIANRKDEYGRQNSEITENILPLAKLVGDIQIGLEQADMITHQLNKTSRQLQTKLNRVRMRPLSDILERLPRALHNLNIEYGKNVQLTVEGENTLVERAILEALNDPIIHLFRNAFAHGIEDPQTRRAVGKPEQGLIEIIASHCDDRIIISLRDDGEGISLEKIYSRALAMGLDANVMAKSSQEELLSLIFEPGFSTSEQVTPLSGRGIGMDVVRNHLKSVRGEITIETELGKGTTFILSVPSTLSVARVLVVEGGKMLLAFPKDVICEVLLLQPDSRFLSQGREFVNWHGNAVPLIYLSDYFQFNCLRYDEKREPETLPAIDATCILIVQGNHQLVAIQIDRCWGEQQLSIKPVEGNILLPKGFSHCSVFPDGRVLPLVNINDMLSWIATENQGEKSHQASSLGLEAFLSAPGNHELTGETLTDNKGVILIIDDSINVCKFLTRTLTVGGYDVEECHNCECAMEKLANGLKVDAIICDLEMPVVNGYEFLKQIKSSTKTSNIPVAILSAHNTSRYHELAMNLGAKAYFSKPYNEEELLKTIDEITYKS